MRAVKAGVGRWWAVAVGVIGLCAVPLAVAQVNRCVGADGRVEYRSQPCPGSTVPNAVNPPAGMARPVATPKSVEVSSEPFTFRGTGRQPPGPVVPLSTGTPPRDLAAGAEVVLVSGYEGSGGQSRVIVHRPGKRVLLVLTSYEPIHWRVEPEASTVIQGVLVASYGSAKGSLAVLPARGGQGVPRAYRVDLPDADQAESQGFRRIVGQLQSWFGVDHVDVFRGSDRVPDLVEIYRTDGDRPELGVAGVQTQKPDVPLTFDLLTQEGRRVRWTNAGPTGAGASADRLSAGKLAVSASGQAMYRLQGDTLSISVDGGRQFVPGPSLPAGFPPFSWAMDVAYDTRRDLVSVVSLGGEGFFYRFDTRRNQWLDYRSLNNVDLSALAYDAASNRYVGWTTSGDLITLSDDGRVLATRPLAKRLPDLGSVYDAGNERVPRLALAPQGDWVALAHIVDTGVTRVWSVHLGTGAAKLTYKKATASASDPRAAASMSQSAGARPAPAAPVVKPVPLVKLTPSAGNPPRNLAAGAEVMLVAGDRGKGSTIKVTVHRPGQAVLLVLSSYDSVSWQVEPEAQTTIRGIVVSTRRGQSVVVGPEDARLYATVLPYAESTALWLKDQIGALNGLFGIDHIDAYRGDPLPAVVEFYRVDANQPGLTLAGVQPEAAGQIFKFDLVDAEGRLVPWTNTGPTAEARASQTNLANGMVTVSGAGKTIYRLESNALRATDRQGKAVPIAPLPSTFPPFSHPTDVAYDTHRDIVAVITLGGGGTLYRYDARHGKWLDFHTLDNPYVNSVTYDPVAQRYVIWSRKADLLVVSKEGAVESSKKIRASLADFDTAADNGAPFLRMALAARGEWVAIMNVSGRGVSHIWSYNLPSGQARLTYKESGDAATSPPSSRIGMQAR